MVRLINPKKKEFIREDFDNYPIWVWDDRMEYKLPITDLNPSRDDYGCIFFIKSIFINKTNYFEGYLIGNENFYAFGIFVNESEYILNKNTDSLNSITLNKISNKIYCDICHFFPIKYKSPVRFNDGKGISGVLDFRLKK